MARKSLADLVRQEQKPAAPDVGAEFTRALPAESPVPTTVHAAPEPEREEHTPRYLSLLRKEARLREDQVVALGRLARRLNRAKRAPSATERITENTLIRIAVDALLANEPHLSGESEDELRRAMFQRISD